MEGSRGAGKAGRPGVEQDRQKAVWGVQQASEEGADVERCATTDKGKSGMGSMMGAVACSRLARDDEGAKRQCEARGVDKMLKSKCKVRKRPGEKEPQDPGASEKGRAKREKKTKKEERTRRTRRWAIPTV